MTLCSFRLSSHTFPLGFPPRALALFRARSAPGLFLRGYLGLSSGLFYDAWMSENLICSISSKFLRNKRPKLRSKQKAQVFLIRMAKPCSIRHQVNIHRRMVKAKRNPSVAG